MFSIGLHFQHIAVLEAIKIYFGGCGVINVKNDRVDYIISGIKDIMTYVIPHFNLYPLCTQKGADYILWSRIANIISCKEHLTDSGLFKCLQLAASINRGLSDTILTAFPGIIAAIRPIITTTSINPYWLSGFAAGDGSFCVSLPRRAKQLLGFQVSPTFELKQHIRDIVLIKLIQEFFNGSGSITINRDYIGYKIGALGHLNNLVIPHFTNYPLHSIKQLDFMDWSVIIDMMNRKEHLTQIGLDRIRNIIAGMNQRRV